MESISINREELIELVEECIAEFFWKHEGCIIVFSDESP